MKLRGVFGLKEPPQRRFAFLLGNSEYAHVGSLRNPANDTGHVASKLREIGFQVFDFRNLDWRNTWYQLKEFTSHAGACDAMLLYYCGHGVQLDGDNYVVPIDFDPAIPVDHDTEAGAIAGLVRVQDIMSAMAGAKARLIFLDACRNEGGLQQVRIRSQPAAAPDRSTDFSQSATRGLDAAQGLAKVRLGEHRQIFICFAADPGDVAEDGPAGGMSPFSEAVASHIGIRGLDVFDLSQRIARDVRVRTEGRQTPWTNSNLTDDFAFYPADNWPVWILGGLGALTGLIGAVMSFDLFKFDSEWHLIYGDLKLHDVRGHPSYLLLPLLFGSVLGFGAYRWGNRSWQAALTTCGIYAAFAALSRFWFAPYASNNALLEQLKCMKPRDFTNLSSVEVRLLLLTAILAAGLTGAASIFSAAPFARDMGKMPRIAMGAIVGAAGALLFLVFLWVRAQVNEWQYDTCIPNLPPGSLYWLEPLGVMILIMAWEAMLGINAGRAYAKPTNE
ncbi:MAG: caspase family protein [Hyphomicrobium sp.]